MPLLALHIHAEGEDVEVVFDVAKKIFQRFSPDFFRFERKNYLRILFFFFFLLFIVVEGKIFSKGFGHVAEYISGNCVRIRIAFVFIIFFLSCAFKTYAITIICFRFNFSIKRQLIIQRMHSVKRKSPRYKFIKLG